MAVAEGVLRLRTCRIERSGKLAFACHEPHAATAAAGRRLDHEGKAERSRGRDEACVTLILRLGTRNGGHAGLARDALGLRLVAHLTDDGWRGPNPRQASIDDRLREIRAFGEKTISGMDRIRTRALRGIDDRGDIQ